MKRSFLTGLFAGVLPAVGPASLPQAPEPPVAVARYAPKGIVVDGVMDEEAWAGAREYALALPGGFYERFPETARLGRKPELIEGGTVRLLWDEEHLYVGAVFTDSDVMNEGDAEQSHFYQTGDLIEVFLKPAGANYYWELYATPHGRRSWFFLPSRGRLLRTDVLPETFRVAATVDGTFNHWQDRDKGWTVEMAIPIRELTAHGAAFGPDAEWTILVARYNYSAHLERPEWSAFPRLSVASFHLYEEYARLRLER